MIDMHTPLAHVAVPNVQKNVRVMLKEDQFRGHLNLRVDAQNVAGAAAVAKVLGVPLPTKPNSSSEAGSTRIFWLGPNEWLVLVAAGTQGQVEADLRAALAGQHVAITDVSSGQTLVNLSGPQGQNVMMKSTVYDCDGRYFPPGKVVQTTFAKTGAIIYRCADGSFDLVIRRSFADYFFLWLKDASEEYGLQVL